MQHDLKHLAKQLKNIGNDFEKKAPKFQSRVNDVLFVGMNNIRNTIITAMQNTPRAGHSYKSNEKGDRHHPSKPGFPPAIDGGTLKDSYIFEVNKMQGEIGSRLDYAEYLETGTKHMEERPVLEPAFDAHKDGIIEDALNVVKYLAVNAFNRAGAK